jgi:protocatechuate 3,4-dioxygenase beta subunit
MIDPRGIDHTAHTHYDASPAHDHAGEEIPLYDRGLAFDVGTLLGRRQMLGMLAAAGLVPLTAGLGVGGSSAAGAATAGAATAGADTAADCTDIPEETPGPFPGDGSNGPNVLDDVGIVRRDIRASFGESHGRARGLDLTVQLTVLDLEHGCKPYEGAAVYVWQCDREGRYSLYSDGVVDQNYLRGVQVADHRGRLRFRSIFPGCYPGRWPHIHFEVYPDVDEATSFRNKIATSQLAFPRKICRKAYGTDGYEASAEYLKDVSLKTDSVFRDGWKDQLARVTGNVHDGFAASLKLAV